MRLNLSPRLWLLVPACALALLAWSTSQRLTRLAAVNALAPWTSAASPIDRRSPSGYTGGQRVLIVPERNEKSFEWITQTQETIARGSLQLHHIDYENAPTGRAVHATSPYRWWLTTLAYIDHTITGQAVGGAVERAALYADPLLLALAVVIFAVFGAWAFGRIAGITLAVGLVSLFPLSAAFLPGAPDDLGATCLFALASLLPLLAGYHRAERSSPWFALGGTVGGFGVWLNAPAQVPILIGVFIGGIVAAGICRSGRAPAVNPKSWRLWALSGSIVILSAYVVENFPDHLASWRLESLHPLYGVAWLGLGEILLVATTASTAPSVLRRPAWLLRIGFSIAAIGSIPTVMRINGSKGFLARDLLWPRLASLPNSAYAENIFAWGKSGATSASLVAVLAPVAIVALAGWLVFRRASTGEQRVSLVLVLGPTLVAFGFACTQLRWWSIFDATALALAVATVATDTAFIRPKLSMLLLAASVAFAGLVQLVPRRDPGEAPTLTASEAQEVIERHFAHWLAARTPEPGAVVYGPPHVTTTLSYYGGFRGLGTFSPENSAGFGTSLAVAGANTMEEAEILLRGRSVRYVVIPSWDPFFDNFASLYLASNFSQRTSLLVNELRRWKLPLWLRPLPYQLPIGGAFENQSVRVFEIVDQQRPATAAARLAEYLIETGDLASAAGAAEQLNKFPGDIAALAARIQVLNARGDNAGTAKALTLLEARLATDGDRFLPWDRRVSLALTLAQADRVAPAVAQTRRCLADLDATKLRTLSTGSLYNFQVLIHAVGLDITDPALRELAHTLLPEELRARL